jgi:hypothetical protein
MTNEIVIFGPPLSRARQVVPPILVAEFPCGGIPKNGSFSFAKIKMWRQDSENLISLRYDELRLE